MTCCADNQNQAPDSPLHALSVLLYPRHPRRFLNYPHNSLSFVPPAPRGQSLSTLSKYRNYDSNHSEFDQDPNLNQVLSHYLSETQRETITSFWSGVGHCDMTETLWSRGLYVIHLHNKITLYTVFYTKFWKHVASVCGGEKNKNRSNR